MSLGETANTEDALDAAPVEKTAGDGTVTKLMGNKTAVFADGITGKTPEINYVPLTELDSGAESPAYPGTDIAESKGEGPKCTVEEG